MVSVRVQVRENMSDNWGTPARNWTMQEAAEGKDRAILNNISVNLHNVMSAFDEEEPIFEALNPTNDSVYMTVSMFRNVSTPLICCLGGVANICACATFLSLALRSTSCNLYLAARSFSDTLFLFTLMIVWLDSIGIPVFHKDGVCQIVVFVTYVSSFISVWMVVAVSFENYIRLCHPASLYLFCTVFKAKIIIGVMVFLAMIIYNFPLWITNIEEFLGQKRCMTNNRYKQLYLVMTYIDTFLTLIIPLTLIMLLYIAIICRAVDAYKRQLRLKKIPSLSSGCSAFWCVTPEAKVTRLLFAVSVIFIVLHSPMHIMRTVMIIKLYIIQSRHLEPIEPSLKKAFETLYYLNFAINFAVYFSCGVTFRKIFVRLFCKCCAERFYPYQPVMKSVGEQTELTFMNGVEESVTYDSRTDRTNRLI